MPHIGNKVFAFHTEKIYVPNGKVIMACGSFTITGCLIADDIEFLEGSIISQDLLVLRPIVELQD